MKLRNAKESLHPNIHNPLLVIFFHIIFVLLINTFIILTLSGIDMKITNFNQIQERIKQINLILRKIMV